MMGPWVSSIAPRQKFLDLLFIPQEDRKGFQDTHLKKIPNQILFEHKPQILENKWMKIRLLPPCCWMQVLASGLFL